MMNLLETFTVKMYYEHLPEDIHAFVSEESKGHYMIVIRAEDSPQEQEKAFLHEMRHIYRNDFHSIHSADTIESMVADDDCEERKGK